MAAGMVTKVAAVVTATTTTSGWNVTPTTPGSNSGDDDQKATKVTTTMKTITDVVVDEDELFELDIALLDGRDDYHHHHHGACRYTAGSGAADDGDGDADADGHALLANCLLPLRAVSSAVPVAAASGRLSSAYPYSGYYGSSSRRLFTPRSSRRFLFLGRSAGNSSSSARLCFSSRGFEAMGNYFQRY